MYTNSEGTITPLGVLVGVSKLRAESEPNSMPKLNSLAAFVPSFRSKRAGLTHLTVGSTVLVALAACGGVGPVAGTGGSVGAGGAPGAGGTTPASGGTTASGGHGPGTGGAVSTGGSLGTGGAATGGSTGTGGAATGGSLGTGGAGPTGGASGTGGESSGDCQVGTTMGNEVLFIGESFIAASDIPEETTKLARAAGSLGASDSYVDKSVSGTWIGNGAGNSIPNQYLDNKTGVRFVIMDGGGNDCWQGGQASDRTNALNAATQLFQDFEANGVEKFVYMFYADPIGSQYNDLKACLDLLRPDMKALCDAQTSPKCYWLDLRDTWNGHNEYTSDGIHVAGPGNVPTATAIWDVMEANCVAP